MPIIAIALGLSLIAAPTKAGAVGVALSPRDVAAVEKTVVPAPWSASRQLPSTCPILYIVTDPNCPHCQAFVRQDMVATDHAGIEMRIILAPTVHTSRDVAAEVGYRRDLLLTMRAQLRQPIAAPPADVDDAHLAAFNGLVYASQTVRDIAHRVGYDGYTPGFLWRDRAGAWRIATGYSAASMERIRASLPPAGPECRPHRN